MNQNQDELISAFVDNETTEFETRHSIKELIDNTALRRRWEHYHLMRDALQRNLSEAYDRAFADRVMACLEDETLRLEPDLASGRWRTPAIAVGMAAALAVVGLVVVKSLDGPRPGLGMAGSGRGVALPMPVVATAGARPDTQSVVFSGSDGSGDSRRGDSAPPLALISSGGQRPEGGAVRFPRGDRSSARMDSFLVNHAQYAVPVGVMPYARVIGYQTDRP